MIKTRRLFENGKLKIWEGEIKKKERKVKRERDWPNGEGVKQISSEA